MKDNRHIKFSNRIICLLMLLLFAFSFSGCYFFPKEEKVLAPPLIEPPKITYDTIDVKKGTIEKKVTGTANFESSDQKDVFFAFKGGNLKNIYVKLGDKVKKGQLIAELDTGHMESQIKIAELDLKFKQLDYDSEKSKGTTGTDLEKKDIKVQKAKINLDDLKQEYNKSKLVAPISGQVVFIDKISTGDYINAFKPILKIADPGKLQLQYQTDNTSDFQLGMAVDIKFKDKMYKGKVVMTPANMPYGADESLKKTIIISLNSVPSGTEIGDSADINVTLQKKENVIVLPRNVINTFASRNYVQILDKNIPVERDVELGMQTPTEVEIVKGLNEGEKVIQR